MDENTCTNFARLIGVMSAPPAFSHASRGESFYTFALDVARLSGTTDTINIVARSELLSAVEACDTEKLCITGELRSFNNKSGEGAKLVITVFAKEILPCDENDLNLICLTGTLCKPPNLRVTPMGRDICDLMLAVNRKYGRSDYLPCITWGLKAREASYWDTGTTVSLEGRIQSRRYIKLIGGEPGRENGVRGVRHGDRGVDITQGVCLRGRLLAVYIIIFSAV